MMARVALVGLVVLVCFGCPPPKPPPLWGFADLHTHPVTNFAFGADSNGHDGILHGQTGGDVSTALTTVSDDLKACAPDVHSGFTIDPIMHQTRSTLMGNLSTMLTQHPHAASGANDYVAWPHSQSVLHQQMHVLELRRAFDAGLRLVFAAATDNELLSRLWNQGFNVFANDPTPSTGFDAKQAAAQLDQIIALVKANSSWMEIATSPLNARGTIISNKLAVVLSLEMDHLSVDEILELVKDKGVRHVIPVHLADNDFGGTAAYNDLFNLSSRFLNGDYIQVEGDPTIEFRLTWPMKLSTTWLLPWPFDGPGGVKATLVDRSEFCALGYEPCDDIPNPNAVTLDMGHRNKRGLSPSGLQKLMKAGVMIDVAHMGEKSVDDALTLAETFGYPLMDSHTSLRDPMPTDPSTGGTQPKKRVTSERDLRFDHALRVSQLGGVLGLGTEGRLEPKSLADHEFSPAQALDSTTPTLVLPLGIQGVLPQSASITELDFTVLTGDNDLGGGNITSFALVDLQNQPSLDVPLSNGAHWTSRSTNTVPITLPPGVTLADVLAVGIQYVPSGGSLWDVDTIDITAKGPSGSAVILHREGLPFRTFSANNFTQWKESIDHSAPPSPGTAVKSVVLTLETGQDDLRGNDDNAWVQITRRDTAYRKVMVNGRDNWAKNSIHTVTVPMPEFTHIGDLDSVVFDTAFTGGFNGDNWDLQSIKIQTDDGTGTLTTIFAAEGLPWHRFTGDDKHKVAWQAPPEASDGSLDASFLRVTVLSGPDGVNDSDATTATITLADEETVSVSFNLGAHLDDFGSYRRIIALPPGTMRQDLAALTLAIDANAGDTWRVARVTVELLTDPVANWLADYQEAQSFVANVALGTDFNGFASQIPFSGARFEYPLHAPNQHAPASLQSIVPLIPQFTLGTKTYDLRHDGLAHYGMIPEMIQAIQSMPNGPAALDALYTTAEATVTMWETCLAVAPSVP